MVRAGVIPQKDNLSRCRRRGWRGGWKCSGTKGSVILYNLSPCEKVPSEWEILDSQGIQRVLSVPLMLGGQVAGFIGVDNPATPSTGRHPGPGG